MAKSEHRQEEKRAADFGRPAPAPKVDNRSSQTARDAQHGRFSRNEDVAGIGNREEQIAPMRGSLNEGHRQKSREGAGNYDELHAGRMRAEADGKRASLKDTQANIRAEAQANTAAKREQQQTKANQQKENTMSQQSGKQGQGKQGTGTQGQGAGGMGAGAPGPSGGKSPAAKANEAKQQRMADQVKARTENQAKQNTRQNQLDAQRNAMAKNQNKKQGVGTEGGKQKVGGGGI